MKNNTQHIDDLLVKHLTGEATEADRLEVQQWLAEDAANQRYYDHFKLIWEESEQLAVTSQVDEKAAWERFQPRLRQGSGGQARSNPDEGGQARVFSLNHPMMRAAAISGLVIGIALLTYFLFQNNPGKVVTVTTIQAVEAVKSDSLPDGSAVVLNKNSQVSYPSHFTGNKRAVQLNGEAFFHVKPNKQKPFVISTNDVTITVVGTSFNVRSRGDTTEIIVETGIVQVATGEQTITLTAGERTTVRRNESQLQKQAGTDQLYNYYRSKKFVCDETPLWKLVEKINEAYNVNIVIGRAELRNLPMTVTFDDEELDKILDVMRQTFEISVVKDKGQIILR